jgi:hypothetical protein
MSEYEDQGAVQLPTNTSKNVLIDKYVGKAPAPFRELIEAAKAARDFVGNLNTTDHPDAVEIYEDLAAAVAKCEGGGA